MSEASQTGQGVRDLYLVVVKLVDVATRAGFVLTATFGLAIGQAGQFGLIATLVGLFAFAFNFERHIDIQRRSAGEDHAVFDRYVVQALKFFAFNWTFMVPLFVVAVALWAQPGWMILGLAVIVVVAEHLSNQAYQYALINHRYYPMLVVVAAKNSLLAAVVLYRALFARDGFDLTFVMQLWAVGAVLCTIGLAIMFARLNASAARTEPFRFGVDIIGQHKASLTHFLIGLIAILILQFDRLAVGGLMTFEETGLYFRHTLLVAFAYQAFNIASFNRITPAIFTEAKTQDIPHLRRRVLREYLKTVVGVPLLLFAAWGVDALTHGVWSERFHLSLVLMGLLLLGFVVRAAADFHALILNARHDERHILTAQGAAFVVGAALLVLLTWRFGVYGAACATIATSALYLVLVSRAVRRLEP
ncbi:O-antigen/teichoic acid export membrane protein [Brevundimonas lenta]|uniref:O-antigen/teichoic acid export membrane protein n=1 Tax=Brevundimonas lenta TaxID=424796 RepID=A0A7W6JHA1_9CAUL|nr:polysaccharide biosynthesis C-terminal domain-containing protein [Brevundimonas lenta]MBB4084121.1 O-antigen/teichoic acid export membrane protein [Brevundimonas lenta]